MPLELVGLKRAGGVMVRAGDRLQVGEAGMSRRDRRGWRDAKDISALTAKSAKEKFPKTSDDDRDR
jgi:hypothetical protein